MRAMRDNGEAGGIVAGKDSSARQAREAGAVVMPPNSVMAGLDLPGFNPGTIHRLRKKFLQRMMDLRVKPAGDCHPSVRHGRA
jgi:hypothetical protein